MKTNFILIFLFLITSSAYTRSKSCPEAQLSVEQTDQIKDLRKNFRANKEGLNREEKRAAWAGLQQSILDIATSQEQRDALSVCFESRKHKRGCPEAQLSEKQTDQVENLRQNFRTNTKGLSKEDRQSCQGGFTSKYFRYRHIRKTTNCSF